MRAVLAAMLLALTGLGAHAEGARPAKTGSRIVYASEWSGVGQIYAADPSGREARGQLTFGAPSSCRFGTPCGFYDPLPAPDGSRVLFWDGQGVNSPSTLFVARANGSVRHALARVEGYEHEAAWAPGSRRLAYVGTDGVHVVGADGSGDRLVGAGRFASSPAWSSDGRSLAFVLEGTLTVVRGPVSRALGRGGPFSWSPNGGRIVYATQEGLVVERADGRDRWLLVPASEVSELA
jgi:Tol biopolymer transport system component